VSKFNSSLKTAITFLQLGFCPIHSQKHWRSNI